MNTAFKTLLRDVQGQAQARAGSLLWPVLRVVMACLTGLVGFGFLTAAIYHAITASVGPGWASLLLGVGFSVLAGVILLFARDRLPKPAPTAANRVPPAGSGGDTTDTHTMIAFTAAFVLGRYLKRKGRD